MALKTNHCMKRHFSLRLSGTLPSVTSALLWSIAGMIVGQNSEYRPNLNLLLLQRTICFGSIYEFFSARENDRPLPFPSKQTNHKCLLVPAALHSYGLVLLYGYGTVCSGPLVTAPDRSIPITSFLQWWLDHFPGTAPGYLCWLREGYHLQQLKRVPAGMLLLRIMHDSAFLWWKPASPLRCVKLDPPTCSYECWRQLTAAHQRSKYELKSCSETFCVNVQGFHRSTKFLQK